MPGVKIDHNLDLDPVLPTDIQELAIQQGESNDAETKAQIIQQFRDHIKEKNEFIPHRMDDEYLQKFLRTRYWNIESSYKLLRNYQTFREQNKDYYEKVRPLDLSFVGDDDIITVTPYRDQHNHRILIYRFGVWKPAKITVDDIFRATCALLELGSLEPITQVVGGIGIFDLKELNLNQVFHLTPSVAQKMLALLVTSMPARTAALHIVNQNWVFSAAFNMFKPFLDQSMRDRLFIHGSDMRSLHKHIHPEHLPKRYGGIHEDYSYTLWFDNLASHARVRNDMEQLGYVF